MRDMELDSQPQPTGTFGHLMSCVSVLWLPQHSWTTSTT